MFGLVWFFVFVVLESKAILVRHERSESVLQPSFFVQEEIDLLFLDPGILLVISLLHLVQGRQFIDEVLQLLDLLRLFLAQVAKVFDPMAQSVDLILVSVAHQLLLLRRMALLLLEGSDLVLEVFDVRVAFA